MFMHSALHAIPNIQHPPCTRSIASQTACGALGSSCSAPLPRCHYVCCLMRGYAAASAAGAAEYLSMLQTLCHWQRRSVQPPALPCAPAGTYANEGGGVAGCTRGRPAAVVARAIYACLPACLCSPHAALTQPSRSACQLRPTANQQTLSTGPGPRTQSDFPSATSLVHQYRHECRYYPM
jgi:hypothetical protein